MKADLVRLILDSLRELDTSDGSAVAQEADANTPLFGRDGVLDSMGLVTLVVAVEQAIEDKYGKAVSLADEKALSQTQSPYKTVGTLADYAARLVADSPR